ncbi:MAG: TonB-dependent receptor [SAR86 cluster bacterium]|jgi:iron complex outermembrane recepter protein|uniref:TonB-dependent receptor n=1 Tax=SAR86 cluster bacterium TaxID=2030880 RepID=A0A972VXZ1_9GAMM|nr:TonB-dependent receptor [SAR86 cluster bacterium]|tara:strand:+ start:8800 stop:10914 length:2115 start_codon:yes stop_codon:yes gene_type:complete
MQNTANNTPTPIGSYGPRLLSGLLLLGCCSILATPAISAELEEVVVMADYRDLNDAQLATSITVISSAVVRQRAAQHFEEIINSIPNFNVSGGTGRSRFFQIRGIGERSQFIEPINPSVGLLIDNVDYSGAGSIATMMDVDQIEVLRGPQGTRYGANALAGLINITTRNPEPEYATSLKANVGDYGHRTLGLTTTGPITALSSFRLAAETHQSDGYYANSFLNRDDVNQRDETSLRGKLQLISAPGADLAWETLLTLANTNVDNGYDAFTLDNSRTTLSDQPGHDRQESTSLALDTTLHLASVDLQLLASLGNTDSEYGYDEDWTFVGIHPDGYSAFDDYLRRRDTLNLEARVISNQPIKTGSLSTDWLVGIYALQTREDLTRIYTYDSDFNSEFDFTNLAIFTQLDTSITDQWQFSTGLRLEQRDASYKDSRAVAFNPKENFWGGRLALQYFPNEGKMLYTSLSRGYKAGGFNTDGSLDADLRQFDAEYLVELELGAKLSLADDTLQLKVAIFYDQRRDQQVKSSQLRVRANNSTEFVEYLGNAARGTNRGFELESRWLTHDNLTLFANIGLLQARFDEFVNEAGENLAGRDQAQAPAYTYNLGANIDIGRWHTSISVDGKDEFYFSDRHSLTSTAYTLLNANISYIQPRWKLSFWGRNLTNKDYTIRGFGSFGNDPRKGYITEPYVQYGEPRMIGVSAEYEL